MHCIVRLLHFIPHHCSLSTDGVGSVFPKSIERIQAGEFIEMIGQLPHNYNNSGSKHKKASLNFELRTGSLCVMEEGVTARGEGRLACDLTTWIEAFTIHVLFCCKSLRICFASN